MKLIEDAIQHYKYGISHDIFKEPAYSYAQLSIVALEKQLQKRPRYDSAHKVNCCPACGNAFTFYGAYRTFYTRPNFCEYCGQAIDWSK